MPTFSNHMSYHEIADALHHAHLTSKVLSLHECQCIDQSLKNPLVAKLMKLHPLPQTSRKAMTRAIEQIRARNARRRNNRIELGVHGIIYGGAREKTSEYLKKTYPPTERPDLMERFRALVREAVFENEEVKTELTISEQDRYEERMREQIQTPAYSLHEIQENFKDYLNHLEQLQRAGSTFAWNILNSLIQHYEKAQSPEQKQEALLSLIRAVDDARTAYHASLVKYVTDRDYSCQKGLEERLIDHHQFLQPVEKTRPATPIEQTIQALTEPFLSHDAAQHGCLATFSPALYRIYCEVAGYQIIKPEPIEIYALIEDLQSNDAELEEQYLAFLKTSSPLSEQMEAYHRNQFRSLLGSIRHKSVLASAKTTPALQFLHAQKLVRITSHHPEETLERVGPEKTEAEIIDEMLERYPCFLGTAHLKLILTLHNLYGRFDGDFETYATFETLEKVAESGITPDSTATINANSIREAYSKHLSSRRVYFYDFYPPTRELENSLISKFYENLHQWPCSEEVLLQWMQDHGRWMHPEQYQRLAVLAAKTGYVHALKVLLNPPYRVSPNYECPDELKKLLYLSAEHGHTEIVQLLIARGATITDSRHSGEIALTIAARNGHSAIVKTLIDAGENPNYTDRQGHSALLHAIDLSDMEAVAMLIDAGANVNDIHHRSGITPLILAVEVGNPQIVKALLDAGANVYDVDHTGATALSAAQKSGNVDIIKMLTEARHSESIATWISHESHVRANRLLKMIPRLKHYSFYSHLSSHGMRGSKSQNHQIADLQNAIIEDDHQGILQLLQENPKIGNTYCPEAHNSALMYALQQGRIGIVEDLMQGEMTPCLVKDAIFYAIEHPSLHHAIPFLAQKHIVKMMSDDGLPIIAKAAQHGCINAIQIFVEFGANIHQNDACGYSAHMYAAEKQDHELFDFLTRHGGLPTHCIEDGNPIRNYLLNQKNRESTQNHNQQPRSLLLTTQQHVSSDSSPKKQV